jgi:hypothetical protein
MWHFFFMVHELEEVRPAAAGVGITDSDTILKSAKFATFSAGHPTYYWEYPSTYVMDDVYFSLDDAYEMYVTSSDGTLGNVLTWSSYFMPARGLYYEDHYSTWDDQPMDPYRVVNRFQIYINGGTTGFPWTTTGAGEQPTKLVLATSIWWRSSISNPQANGNVAGNFINLTEWAYINWDQYVHYSYYTYWNVTCNVKLVNSFTELGAAPYSFPLPVITAGTAGYDIHSDMIAYTVQSGMILKFVFEGGEAAHSYSTFYYDGIQFGVVPDGGAREWCLENASSALFPTIAVLIAALALLF